MNRGCTYGKSVLAERTACDWISYFHDADEITLPNFVSTARKWMSRNEDVDVVAFGCEERWEDTGDLIGTSVPEDEGLSKDPIGYTITQKINAISGLYRRRRSWKRVVSTSTRRCTTTKTKLVMLVSPAPG